jgi:hypothetical protein
MVGAGVTRPVNGDCWYIGNRCTYGSAALAERLQRLYEPVDQHIVCRIPRLGGDEAGGQGFQVFKDSIYGV